jgi:endonuclease YncB( thermonuclease family)
MGGPYQILLPLLSLFLVRVDLTDLYPISMRVQVLKIYDGDTVLVQRAYMKLRVRLARIDAPEKDQPFLNGKRGAGLLSKACLEKNLSLNPYLRIEGFDLYGRVLGDFEGLSLKLVELGCVVLYPYAKFKNQSEKFLFLRSYLRARLKRRGLWAFGGILHPKAWRKKKFSKRFLNRQSHR